MFDIKCTDSNHPARKNHANAEVKKRWYDGVLVKSSVQRTGMAEICAGCSLANTLEAGPAEKTLEERVKALEDA